MKYIVTLNGKQYEVEVNQSEAVLTSVKDAPIVAAPAQEASASAPVQSPKAQAVEGIKVLAPMPGTILCVKVAVGDVIKAGQVLAILEAMKMENEIAAPQDGMVKQILTRKGANVAADDVLLVI